LRPLAGMVGSGADMSRRVLVTGCCGLVGSEAVLYFDRAGDTVVGIDNNMRRDFFGDDGDTSWNLRWLRDHTRHFTHLPWDIRDRERILALFAEQRFDRVIHAAAQPSHELAAKRPFDDFDINAVGTLNLLEAARRHAPEAPFCLLSTNKVYGDGPNRLSLVEHEARFDYADPAYRDGIAESFPIDHTTHSIFGASKVAADVMAQEYARYFGLPVGIFRGGCFTGARHSGSEMHGFLNYLVKAAVTRRPYTIYGYKGKQVRDHLHGHDVVRALDEFCQSPRSGAVYNLGGGRENSLSVLEAIERVGALTGERLDTTYDERNRVGDHICYISDLRKLRQDYPRWEVSRSIDDILAEMLRHFHAA
jgi:CDP-paratose 2-epimerase